LEQALIAVGERVVRVAPHRMAAWPLCLLTPTLRME
jgi:hypothetical protein